MSEPREDLLRAARRAIRANDIAGARNLLAALVKAQPGNEEAWLMLARVLERDDQTIYCLRRALKINPGNSSAARWLSSLQRKQSAGTDPSSQVTTPSKPAPSRMPAGQPALVPKPGPETVPLAAETGALDEDAYLKKLLPRQRRNWPLLLGAALFLLVAFLAIAGPALAPRDPLEENLIIQVNGKWEVPPYEIFTPGFPLGSDEFGRDLLSRLLWAIRPTMVMVLIVATVRLLLGVIIGLLAGWSNGLTGRSLDTVIEGALSIPVLMVALGAIAIVGVELGIWAFIIGLSLTGWVESAQQVREQTRITKGREYVQAARALGASNRQILASHVLRQITPMTVMLYAFELSSTLMTTAGLGFLGYYIGGDVWVDVSDFVARRISGTPELGQMLATSWARLTEPWAMVVVGTTIFIAVLGFNLLGEGLRQRLDLAAVRRRGIVARTGEKVNFWLDRNVLVPLSTFFRKPVVRMAVVGALLLAMGIAAGSWLWPRVEPRLAGSPPATPLAASQPGDVNGELAAAAATQSSLSETVSAEIDWEFTGDSGLDGGPALSPQKDVLYVASTGGSLYALSLDGEVIWQTQLPSGSAGTPAVAANGDIYVSDDQAGLAAVSAEGERLWHFQSQAGSRSVSGPTVGSDGRVFFTVTTGSKGFVQAVSPSGESLWASEAKTPSFFEAPRLSPDERFVFLKNDVFDARTGERLELESDLNVLRYFPGQDGQMYLLAGQNVIQWRLNGRQISVLDVAEWDSSGLSEVAAPSQVGVLPDGTAWLLYSSPGGTTNLVWVTLDDQLVGTASYSLSRGRWIGTRQDRTTYVCGGRPFNDEYAECAALVPDVQDPLWKLSLGDHGLVQGGLWLNGKLYVATSGGMLFAIREEREASRAAAVSTAAPADESAVPSQTGLLWKYKFDGDIWSGPFGPDLNKELYILTEQNTLYRLNADGELEARIALPSGPHQLDLESRRSTYIWPLVAPDGSVFTVSEGNTVSLYDTQGELLWEEALDSDPQGYAWDEATGTLYLAGQDAEVYKFDRAGLAWTFRSSAAPYTASDPVTGPDGTVYYVVTNRGKGFVQAVSAEGEALWATEAKTGFFYNTPQVSPDGRLVFLKDDVFDAASGARLQLDIPFRIDEFIMGEDGNLYLRSGNNVIQWRYDESGFEILQTASWNASQASASSVFLAYVDENSVIWLYYRDVIAWLKPDGHVIATRQTHSAVNSLTQNKVNADQVITTQCIRQATTTTLTCAAYTSDSRTPFWESRVDGVPQFEINEVSWVSGDFYVASGDTLYKFYVGEPPE